MKNDLMQNASGFTLLEVIIALALITMALFGLLAAYQSSQAMWSTRFHDEEIAMLIIEEKLSDVKSAEFRQMGADTGTFDDRFQGFTWSVEQRTIPSASDTKLVTVSVKSPAGKAYSISELVADIHFMTYDDFALEMLRNADQQQDIRGAQGFNSNNPNIRRYDGTGGNISRNRTTRTTTTTSSQRSAR